MTTQSVLSKWERPNNLSSPFSNITIPIHPLLHFPTMRTEVPDQSFARAIQCAVLCCKKHFRKGPHLSCPFTSILRLSRSLWLISIQSSIVVLLQSSCIQVYCFHVDNRENQITYSMTRPTFCVLKLLHFLIFPMMQPKMLIGIKTHENPVAVNQHNSHVLYRPSKLVWWDTCTYHCASCCKNNSLY